MSKPRSKKSGSKPRKSAPKVSRKSTSVKCLFCKPDVTTEVVQVNESQDVGDTFRQLFGAEFSMEEMLSHEITTESGLARQLRAQGVSVYAPSIRVVCHIWREHKLYSGPDYDTFMMGQRMGVFPLTGLNAQEIEVLKSSVGNLDFSEACTHIEYADQQVQA